MSGDGKNNATAQTKFASMEDIKLALEKIDRSEYTKHRLENVNENMIGQKISTFGWITSSSALKNFSFFELTSSFKSIKCVISGSHDFKFQTSVTIFGTVKESNKRDKHLFEVAVDAFEIYNNEVAPIFPLNDKSDKESKLDKGHLALRMKDRALFLKARANLLHHMRDFYYKNSYTEITPPTLVQTQVEGGATLFEFNYYGEKAYLTQSSQLYLETAAPVGGKVFCIMPSYRAEKSKTSRHLSEFTHVEGELVDITFPELMDSIENLVRYSIENFYKDTLPSIKEVFPDFEPFQLSPEPFKRLSYKDAIEFLRSKNHLKTDGTPYEYMDDIADASEKFICAEYGNNQPVFLTHFPFALKAFYMKKIEGDLTESCDLLFPNVGETVGGSMRLDKYDQLYSAFEREGIDPKNYDWYLDMALFGPSRHGGYGLGFERLLMGLMKYKNVDESCIYPRKVSRCKP